MAKFSLFPRDDKFFDLFEASAQNMVRASASLKKLIVDWDNVDQRIEELIEIEHQGDSITHEIMSQLNRSFITPFDREDVVLLAQSLDDVTDLIQAAGDAMLLYKVKTPRERAKQLAEVLDLITGEVGKAIPQLRKHTSNMQKIMESCVEIKYTGRPWVNCLRMVWKSRKLSSGGRFTSIWKGQPTGVRM
jgi:predicted phosphate transport protein (TIGR00153 family)